MLNWTALNWEVFWPLHIHTWEGDNRNTFQNAVQYITMHCVQWWPESRIITIIKVEFISQLLLLQVHIMKWPLKVYYAIWACCQYSLNTQNKKYTHTMCEEKILLFAAQCPSNIITSSLKSHMSEYFTSLICTFPNIQFITVLSHL